MDTGTGNFAMLSESKAQELAKKDVKFFTVGEEVELKGSKFIVHQIKPKKLVLKLVARQ